MATGLLNHYLQDEEQGILPKNTYQTYSAQHSSNENEVSGETFAPKKDPFEKITWYHGDISQSSAEAILKTHKLKNSFLLRREICNGEKRYSLNALSCERVWQFEVKYNSNTNIVTMGLREFNSIGDFERHLVEGVRIQCADMLYMYLKNPIRVVIDESIHTDTIQYHQYSADNSFVIKSNTICLNSAAVNNNNLIGEFTRVHSAPNKLEYSNLQARLSTYSGYLVKQGHRIKNWKTRFFVLKDGKLSYYVNAHAKRPKNTLYISDLVKLEKRDHTSKKKFCFTLTFRGNYSLKVHAVCKEEYDKWMLRITNALPTTFRGIIE